MNFIHTLFLLFFVTSLVCADSKNFYKDLQTKLIISKDGDVINIPKGTFSLERSLWGENLSNIIIEGQGIDSTILTFENQIEGAEGIKIINSKNIILKNFTIENSKGDLIKIEDSKNIQLLNIKAQWSNGPKETNGSYAFYPVKSENILIDNCIAIGASDAGIYVGQSRNIVVKDCEVFHNVAGIEIENSTYADVFNNYAHNNTGGILIFDLPDLLIKKGGYVRIFNNLVVENNLYNFAPIGNIVAKVPSGTGIMVLAASNIEIFNNKIIENKTANTSIVSYYITEEEITDLEYYPYPTSIFLYDNIFRRSKQFPSFSWNQPIGFLLAYNYWRNVPNIIYDGILDPEKINVDGKLLDKYKICLKNNINSSFANLDAGNNFANVNENYDDCICEHEKINPVELLFLNKN